MKSFEEKVELLRRMESAVACLRLDMEYARNDTDAIIDCLSLYTEKTNSNDFWGCKALGAPEYIGCVASAMRSLTEGQGWDEAYEVAKKLIKEKFGYCVKLDACDSRDICVTEENIDELIAVADANIKKMEPYIEGIYKRACKIHIDRSDSKSYIYLFERLGKPM